MTIKADKKRTDKKLNKKKKRRGYDSPAKTIYSVNHSSNKPLKHQPPIAQKPRKPTNKPATPNATNMLFSSLDELYEISISRLNDESKPHSKNEGLLSHHKFSQKISTENRPMLIRQLLRFFLLCLIVGSVVKTAMLTSPQPLNRAVSCKD